VLTVRIGRAPKRPRQIACGVKSQLHRGSSRKNSYRGKGWLGSSAV
jgi:hypothetical protein